MFREKAVQNSSPSRTHIPTVLQIKGCEYFKKWIHCCKFNNQNKNKKIGSEIGFKNSGPSSDKSNKRIIC